jgi:hypothetical protein
MDKTPSRLPFDTSSYELAARNRRIGRLASSRLSNAVPSPGLGFTPLIINIGGTVRTEPSGRVRRVSFQHGLEEHLDVDDLERVATATRGQGFDRYVFQTFFVAVSLEL